MSDIDEKMIRFVINNMNLTPEEIKKELRKRYPREKIYNENVEEWIIQASKRSSRSIYHDGKKAKEVKEDDNER